MPDNAINVVEPKIASHFPQLGEALEHLRERISSVYGEQLWTAIKTGIAVVGALSFKGLAHPISLLYEGGSGKGKSTIINILNPDGVETEKFVCRIDNFTPHSFVSHAANVSKKDLAQVDLLPQVKDKVLLVKELAPLFRGREDELRANFAILTAVLDGKGYVSASGVHGKRGYEGSYVFNWLGATTPVPAKTDAIMAQLGNRILRYEIVGEEPSDDELMEFAKSFEPETQEVTCRKAVNDFLRMHFTQYPLREVDPSSVVICDGHLSFLVRLARFIAQGRVEVTHATAPNGLSREEEDDLIRGTAEGPYRIIVYLRTIASALALVSGRREVNAEDMAIILHIAFSTITQTRRNVLRAVLLAGGKLDSVKASELLKVSRPTARNRMRELAATGIVSWQAAVGNGAESITLADKWQWLLDDHSQEEEETDLEIIPEAETGVPLWVKSQPFSLGQHM
jgi:hypothetical protein